LQKGQRQRSTYQSRTQEVDPPRSLIGVAAGSGGWIGLTDQFFDLNQQEFIGSFCLLGANARTLSYQ
jgi:hypothetical protein